MKLIEIKKLKLAIHPLFLILAIIMIALGYIEQFFILFILVTVHELAHIITAKIFGANLVKIIIYPIGEIAILDNILLIKPIKRLFIIFAGPIINILLAISFSYVGNSSTLKFITMSNLLLGIFNLLPIYPLDGGKITHLILSNIVGILNANDMIIIISKIFIVCMFILGAIQIILYPFNISIICVAFYLKANLKKEEFNLSLEFFRSIFSKTEFIDKYGYMKTNIITVSENVYIRDILRYLKTDSMCRVYIVDKELNLIGNLNENQLISFIVKYGTKSNLKSTIKTYSS